MDHFKFPIGLESIIRFVLVWFLIWIERLGGVDHVTAAIVLILILLAAAKSAITLSVPAIIIRILIIVSSSIRHWTRSHLLVWNHVLVVWHVAIVLWSWLLLHICLIWMKFRLLNVELLPWIFILNLFEEIVPLLTNLNASVGVRIVGISRCVHIKIT